MPRLLELAVLAAPAVEAGVYRAAINARLTRDASSHAGKSVAAGRWDLITTFQAMRGSIASRQMGARSQYAVRHGVVDLVLYRTVWGPSACHRHHLPGCNQEKLKMGIGSNAFNATGLRPPSDRRYGSSGLNHDSERPGESGLSLDGTLVRIGLTTDPNKSLTRLQPLHPQISWHGEHLW